MTSMNRRKAADLAPSLGDACNSTFALDRSSIHSMEWDQRQQGLVHVNGPIGVYVG